MHELTLPKTAAEYIICFRQLAAITDDALNNVENHSPIQLSALDTIAQSVETIACLRGDSGIYENSRPEGLTEYQSEMYATENYLRDRLVKLGYTYPSPRFTDGEAAS